MPDKQTVNLKILLNGRFKPLFLKKKTDYDKQYHIDLLKNILAQMFLRVLYPLNINNGKPLDFKLLVLSKKGIVVLLKTELVVNDKNDIRNIRKYNIHPDFVKNISVS